MVTFGLIQPMLLPTSPIFKVVSDQAPAKVLETSVRTLLSRDSTTVIPSNSRLATRFTMDQESSLSLSSHKP